MKINEEGTESRYSREQKLFALGWKRDHAFNNYWYWTPPGGQRIGPTDQLPQVEEKKDEKQKKASTDSGNNVSDKLYGDSNGKETVTAKRTRK